MEGKKLSSASVIAAFPVPNRTQNVSTSRLFTEKAIVTLVKSMTTGSYVVEYSGNTIKFMLGGYYFECNLSTLLGNFGNNESLYAYLNYNAESLSGDKDSFGEGGLCFEGVLFSNKVPTDSTEFPTNCVFIELLKKDNKGNISVPESSLIRFDNNSVSFDVGTYKSGNK